MADNDKIIIFGDEKIRRIWYNEEWFYSVVDIIKVLTESLDPRNYWKVLKHREPQLVTICNQLKLEANDGKKYATDCVNTKSAFRLIQSIPSKKAEPFKLWLAQLGQERIDEIENPEIGQDRIKEYYKLKGYPKSWIDKRLRGVAIRQELTEEWKNRDVGTEREFAILTNEISKATFGFGISDYKEYKGLTRKNQNLRDHMTDLELIFTMLGEASTTEITKNKNSQKFEGCLQSAKEGGEVARNAREDLERKSGTKVVSDKNNLGLEKGSKKRLDSE